MTVRQKRRFGMMSFRKLGIHVTPRICKKYYRERRFGLPDIASNPVAVRRAECDKLAIKIGEDAFLILLSTIKIVLDENMDRIKAFKQVLSRDMRGRM